MKDVIDTDILDNNSIIIKKISKKRIKVTIEKYSLFFELKEIIIDDDNNVIYMADFLIDKSDVRITKDLEDVLETEILQYLD